MGPTPARPPSAVFDHGHAFSDSVPSERERSSVPRSSNAARLRRAGGLHSHGPTPSNSIFPAPTPHPPALGKPRRAGPAAPFRGEGVIIWFEADWGIPTVLEGLRVASTAGLSVPGE